MTQALVTTRVEAGVGIMELSRPEKFNSLSTDVMRGIDAARGLLSGGVPGFTFERSSCVSTDGQMPTRSWASVALAARRVSPKPTANARHFETLMQFSPSSKSSTRRDRPTGPTDVGCRYDRVHDRRT